MDHFSFANDSVAIGNGVVLHVGRLYPHPVDTGPRDRVDPDHSGTKSHLANDK